MISRRAWLRTSGSRHSEKPKPRLRLDDNPRLPRGSVAQPKHPALDLNKMAMYFSSPSRRNRDVRRPPHHDRTPSGEEPSHYRAATGADRQETRGRPTDHTFGKRACDV